LPLPSNQPPVPIHQTYSTADPSSIQTHTVAQVDESYGTDGYDYGEYGDDEMYDGTLMDNNAAVDNNKGTVNPREVESFIVHERGNYICSLCGKHFVQNKSNCKRHILIVHCESGPAVCPECNRVYRTDQSMKAHMRHSHGICQTK